MNVNSPIYQENKMADENIRDEKGRFKPGYSGGPGRPKKDVENAYLNAVMDALSPTELTDLIKQLMETEGWRPKAFAAELIMHYALGKPVQRVHQTGNGLADILAMLGQQKPDGE